MCISLITDGQVVTCPMLMEQLWYAPTYNTVAITEVYDVVIRNDDASPIAGLWILYPHDLTQQMSKPRADVLTILPGQQSQYDWYFVDEPKWVDDAHERIRLSVPSEEYELGSQGSPMRFDCTRLLAKAVSW